MTRALCEFCNMYLECAVILLILYSVIVGPCTSSTTCQSKYTHLNQNLPLGRNVFSLSAHCALAQSLCVALAPGWGWWWWWGARPAAAAVQWPLVLIGVAFWPLSCFISLIGSKWPPCWLFTSCAGNHMLHTRSPLHAAWLQRLHRDFSSCTDRCGSLTQILNLLQFSETAIGVQVGMAIDQ